MKKKFFLMPVFFALVFFACGKTAKADTWTTQYLVDKNISGESYFTELGGGVEDSRGHKWFAAWRNSTGKNHLYEYTGSEWIDHTSAFTNLVAQNVENLGWDTSGDPRRLVGSMYADLAGNVWITAQPGTMMMYDGTNWNLVPTRTIWQQVAEEPITNWTEGSFYNVFGDAKGNVYAIAVASFNGLDHNETFSVLKRSTDGTWSTAIPNGGIMEYSSGGELRGAYNDSTGDFWFHYRYGTNSNGATYGEASGVYRYHDGSWTNYTTADGLASNAISNISADSKGNVWVGTGSGASKFDGAAWTSWNTENSSLASNNINKVSEDSKGRIWFTTVKDGEYSEGGAAIYDPATNGWDYYSPKNAYDSFIDVSDVFFYDDEMWAWTQVEDTTSFLVLSVNDIHATLYGQVGGTIVEAASLGDLTQLKKKKDKAKKFTMYRRAKVKKKWKWKVTKRGKTSNGWYKALNLPVGTYKVAVQGKRTKVATITSGDPYRLNF